MSTTYMVKSSLVFLACHINVLLLTILFLFAMSKSTQQHYILTALQMIIYVLGVLFNVYVVLSSGRKWEPIVRYFENSISYMRMMQQEITCNILNSIKASVQQASTAVNSILESLQSSPEGSTDSSNHFKETEPVASNEDEKSSKSEVRQFEETIKVQTPIFQEETAPRLQATFEDTPELKLVYNLRHLNRPKSDPVKKTAKNEVVKAQSPELLKNKIFKSRMILICDSPRSRMDKK